MKKLTISAFIVLLICILAYPVMAAEGGAEKSANLNQELKFGAANGNGKNNVAAESKGKKLHKAHFQDIEDRKKKRDEGLKLRAKNIKNNNPGNLGL